MSEPTVTHATVRDAVDELHIECRFSDGQKFAAVKVDAEFPELASLVAELLNNWATAPKYRDFTPEQKAELIRLVSTS